MDVAQLGNGIAVKGRGQIIKFQYVFQDPEIVFAPYHSIQQGCKRNGGHTQGEGTDKFSARSHKWSITASCHPHENADKKSHNIFPKHKKDHNKLGYKDHEENSEIIHSWGAHGLSRTDKG